MAAEPFTHEDAQDFRPRIRQLRARRRSERERDGRLIFESRKHGVWIAVSQIRGGYRLEFYRSCPCGG